MLELRLKLPITFADGGFGAQIVGLRFLSVIAAVQFNSSASIIYARVGLHNRVPQVTTVARI
jgi:hypothetical protein